jgi:hypothetical protein
MKVSFADPDSCVFNDPTLTKADECLQEKVVKNQNCESKISCWMETKIPKKLSVYYFKLLMNIEVKSEQ